MLGNDFSGIVVESSYEAHPIKPGDEVYGMTMVRRPHGLGCGTRSLSVLKPGGLIVNVPTGSLPTLAEDATAAGVRASGYRVSADGSTLAVISRLLDSGDVRVFVEQVFDLDQAAATHTALETGHTRGKIVLKVSDG